jgi:hypothetical protein
MARLCRISIKIKGRLGIGYSEALKNTHDKTALMLMNVSVGEIFEFSLLPDYWLPFLCGQSKIHPPFLPWG